MKRTVIVALGAVLAAGLTLAAQSGAPDIAFESAASPLSLPDDVYLGEVAGVGVNSKGDLFVYTRTGHPTVTIGTSRAFLHGGSRLFQFDRSGKFVRELLKDSYGELVAQQVRIDAQDNIWVVDQMSGYVMKLDPNGHLLMLLGRKPESVNVPANAGRGGGGRGGRGGLPGAGAQSDVFNRPTDVAWDGAGNIFVADGMGNARVAKFDSKGVFVTSWGSRGSEPGMFANVTGIAVDAQGNVYAADGGNKRVQVFDNNGRFKTQFANIGSPMALCMTPPPNQVLFVSNSNPPDDFDNGGEIYKLKLDGTILGRFGTVGKRLKEFGSVNAIDCRSEHALVVGELANMRVQKLTLR
ncbi:MAG TPA: 6-bladed beta-propeller [Vicinamibacterales bacterium]|nr:6-bladed beta-propeller [Vicinamibacterales bacterium]